MGILSNLFKKKQISPLEQEEQEALKQENLKGNQRQGKVAQQLHCNFRELSEVNVSIDWYRRIFPLIVKLSIVLMILVILSICTNVVMFMQQSEPRYFAATSDFRMKEMVPLNEPLVSQGGLINWLTRTTGDCMSINFLDWRKQLMAVRPHFSPKGYEEFLLALKKSQLLDLIKEKRLSSQVMITKTPVIVGQGIIPSTKKMAWKIEFGLRMMLESSNGREYEDDMAATVVIQRANTMTNPSGLEIRQFVLD